MNDTQIIEQELSVIQTRFPHSDTHRLPYHVRLQNCVRDIHQAHVNGYPINQRFVDQQRDYLSRILEERAGKS
jgi:hypothetical protein